jgi:hypothetical protein
VTAFIGAVRASNAVGRRKARRATMTTISLAVIRTKEDERERRYYQRQALIDAPADAKKRIKALIQMGPPDADEAARLVADFEARKSVTRCPVMACAEIRNGDGFA